MRRILAIIPMIIILLTGCSAGTEKSETPPAAAQATQTENTTAETAAPTEPAPAGFSADGFSEKNGVKYYSDNSTESLFGIDVSSYSGDIDWKTVAESVDFAYIRIGGRGYGDSGAIYPDAKADYNLEQASKYGIKTGVYFYSQAVSTAEAEEEADYVYEKLSGVITDLPVAYDFEHIKSDTARTDDIDRKTAVKLADAFCKRIKARGMKAIVYVNSEDKGGCSYADFDPESLWYADYSGAYPLDTRCKIWQYSSQGKLDGINGSVDFNMMFEER